MKTKLLGLGFLSLFSCFVHAQVVINTNHPNNNSNASVTFEVQNTNPYDIIIIGAQCHLGTATTNNIQLLYNTTPDVDSSPPWSFGTVGAGQNGWISAGTGVVSNSDITNGIVSVLSNLSLTIPAGATYQLGLSTTTMRYSTLASGAGINTFSGGGVNLLTGDGISWGGTIYPTTPANYPRGIIGGITFVSAMHFAVSAPATATAGTAFNFTVTALDASNNIMTGYTGTVHFTSSDGVAVLPADATLTNGTGTFSATLKTAGSQTITAKDTVIAAMIGTSAPTNVGAGAATHLSVGTPANAMTGASFPFDVSALDQFENTDTAYAGTVHFTSTDGAAVLPGDATLTNGTGTFSATLQTVGSQTIAATDTVTASITGTSAPVDVSPSPATHFAVSAPATVTQGSAFNFTVTALDQNNTTVTGYSGTVHFTSTDAGAALPADSTLTNGTGTFSATLATAGNQTITATDQIDSLLGGTSGLIFAKTVSSVALLTECQPTFVAGQDFTATAVVTGFSPTGTVDFLAGGNNISGCTGVTLTSGSASCDTNALPIGQGALTATYSGDASNTASGSADLDVTILDPAAVVWRNSFEEIVAGCPAE